MQIHLGIYIMVRGGKLTKRVITKMLSCGSYTELLDMIEKLIKAKNTPFMYEVSKISIELMEIGDEHNLYFVNITLIDNVVDKRDVQNQTLILFQQMNFLN